MLEAAAEPVAEAVVDGEAPVPDVVPLAGPGLSPAAATACGLAPAALRGRVQHVWNGTHGLTARLSRGPLLYFGSTDRLDAKWIAVTRVLEDPDAAGALYLDVRLPERTAAGGLAAPSTTQPSTGG